MALGTEALGGVVDDGPGKAARPERAATGPAVAESTRDRLVEAAADLFAERGYERTSIQDVARRAGLTSGAIYSNFRGKRELLMAAISRPSEALGRQVRSARDAGASVLDLIRVGSARLVSHRGDRQRPILVNSLVLASRDRIVGQQLRRGLTRTFADFGRLVEAGQAEGSVDPDIDVRAYTHYAYALTFGTYLLETAGMPAPEQEAWDRLMARLLGALSGGPAAP